MQNIAGFGLQVTLVASTTFPNGILLTNFADDSDPFDTGSVQIADGEMTLNGDLLTWSTANKIPLTLNLIPGSDSDRNMTFLAEANRPGLNKTVASDVITVVAVYPQGNTVTYSGGFISDAMFANSIASSGRQKSKTYIFQFENRSES